MPTIKRILCPVDFSDTAAVGAREAAALARASGAELLLVHVLSEPWLATSRESGFPAPIAQQYEMIARCKLDAVSDALHEMTRVRSLIVHGPVEEAVSQAALKHGADVIVMGGRRRKGLAKLLSDGMTERVMLRARVPVVRVSPAERRKPPVGFHAPHGVA
ncbi:MAG: uspF [Myxococcaceae bacterium]|nr:uspF [Myxococcaceae bacterium]